jgi:hypothetical protein
MEANILSSGLPAVGELWGMAVKGVPMLVESSAWMDDDGTPVVRLYVASAVISGDEVAISFEGVVAMIVGLRVTLNEPFAVTIRYVESVSV